MKLENYSDVPEDLINTILPWIREQLNATTTETELIDQLPRGNILIKIANSILKDQESYIKEYTGTFQYKYLENINSFTEWAKTLKIKNLRCFDSFDCYNSRNLKSVLITIESIMKFSKKDEIKMTVKRINRRNTRSLSYFPPIYENNYINECKKECDLNEIILSEISLDDFIEIDSCSTNETSADECDKGTSIIDSDFTNEIEEFNRILIDVNREYESKLLECKSSRIIKQFDALYRYQLIIKNENDLNSNSNYETWKMSRK